MSFSKNECQQLTLNDGIFSLTARELRMLEKSWAKPFAEKIFPRIKEEKHRRAAAIQNKPVNAGFPSPEINVRTVRTESNADRRCSIRPA